ncbi:hypothetical protein [Nocardioides sp. MH1]|uniref:hypothetical protein n=1 Tax=Nocardioides sp. MH1 TaxID=3242490 RepID=UPI00351FC710
MIVLGWLVGLVDVGQFLPQARHTLRLRKDATAIRGLSVWTWTIATLQGIAWVVYGFAEGLLPIAVPNLVITPICATILAIRLSHRASSG